MAVVVFQWNTISTSPTNAHYITGINGEKTGVTWTPTGTFPNNLVDASDATFMTGAVTSNRDFGLHAHNNTGLLYTDTAPPGGQPIFTFTWSLVLRLKKGSGTPTGRCAVLDPVFEINVSDLVDLPALTTSFVDYTIDLTRFSLNADDVVAGNYNFDTQTTGGSGSIVCAKAFITATVEIGNPVGIDTLTYTQEVLSSTRAKFITSNFRPNSSGIFPATMIFEYGTSTAYGNTLVPDEGSSIGNCSGGNLVATGTFINLTPSTTYHARLKWTDNAGVTTTGPDFSFTTLAGDSILAML